MNERSELSSDDDFCEAAAEWDHEWLPYEDDPWLFFCAECGVEAWFA